MKQAVHTLKKTILTFVKNNCFYSAVMYTLQVVQVTVTFSFLNSTCCGNNLDWGLWACM